METQVTFHGLGGIIDKSNQISTQNHVELSNAYPMVH
jgi:hypothetical protein